MARHFNGTSQFGTFTWSQFQTTLMVGAWVWRDNTTVNVILLESAVGTFPSDGSWDIIANQTLGHDLMRQEDAAHNIFSDTYPTPSAGAWHYHLWVMKRGISNQVWIDGVAQTMTPVTHNTIAGPATLNQTITLAARAGGSLFWTGRIAELACWSGVTPTTAQAQALARCSTPFETHPRAVSFDGGVDLWFPLLGRASPEPNVAGFPDGAPTARTMTLAGAPTVLNHPGIRTFYYFGRAAV